MESLFGLAFINFGLFIFFPIVVDIIIYNQTLIFAICLIRFNIQMGRRDKKIRGEGRSQFREFLFMNERLHQMLRFLGQQQIKGAAIKLDQFERLRQQFVQCGGRYETANNKIKIQSNQVQRAKLLFQLMQKKRIMEENLKAMTTLILKLNEKVKREKVNMDSKGLAKANRNVINDEIDPDQADQQRTPLQKQLEYKKLIVYTFQKTFFKLMGTQRKEVNKIKRDLNNGKFQSLQQFKRANLPVDRLLQEEQQQTLEQREVLIALKEIDEMIDERVDNMLQGIKILHQNALNISDSLDNLHTKVMINLDKIEHNNNLLDRNRKRIDQASKVVTQPSCILNVIILVLLGLMAFLIVKFVWFT